MAEKAKKTFTVTYYRLLSLVVIAALIASIPVTMIVNSNFEQDLEKNITAQQQEFEQAQEDQTFRFEYNACRRNNIPKAYLIYEARTTNDQAINKPVTDKVFPILNCTATVREGRNIALKTEVQKRYIKIVVEEKKLPIVKNGKIIDKEPIAEVPLHNGYNPE